MAALDESGERGQKNKKKSSHVMTRPKITRVIARASHFVVVIQTNAQTIRVVELTSMSSCSPLLTPLG
jgi:hypothetical protein